MGILRVCSPAELKQRLALDVPGGFSWWYCDLVDERGDGVVLIWFFGLPFLPGYPAPGSTPRQHPGLNVAVYRGGVPTFYLLQEAAHGEVDLADDAWRWRFDGSSLALRWDGDEVALEARLELTVPGTHSPCRVSLDARGPRSRVSASDGDERHVWCPIAPSAQGCVVVDAGGGDRWTTHGRAYLDANSSVVGFDELGVEAWHWGRIAFPEREVVVYAMVPLAGPPEPATVMSIPRGMREARSDSPELLWFERRRNVYGLEWHERGQVRDADGRTIDITVHPPVEEGPFYLRFLIEGRCAETGETGRGIAEFVNVTRIGERWQQPFVRMRRHRAVGDNSMWLPLFTGSRSGRVRRLLRHWIGSLPFTGARP